MSCCTPQGICTQAANCETRGSYQPRRTCEELGICQGRYPACGRCDDDHSADEPPTPTPFEKMYCWCISAAIAVAAVCVVGVLGWAAGATVHVVSRLLPL